MITTVRRHESARLSSMSISLTNQLSSNSNEEDSMEFGQAKIIVKEKAESQWDELFTPRNMEFENFDTISINGTSYQVGKHAKRLIGQRLRVPAPYIDRCPSHLQAEQLNWWLRQQNQDTDLFCRFEDNTLRAMFTKRYKPMDNVEIIEQLDVPDNTGCMLKIDDGMLQLSLPDRKSAFDVSPGDEMIPGVSVSNSEVGLKTFSVSAYYLRIACLNGMVVTDYISQSFRHTSTRGLDNFGEVMSSVSTAILRSNEQFKVAIDAEVEDAMLMIANLAKSYQFTKQAIEHIQEHYEGPQTMFGVIQAFTAAAKDISLSVERSYALERAGGKILMLTK